MRVPFTVAEAFGQGPFSGNPAAIAELTEWLPDKLLSALAATNAQPMTGFFVPDLPPEATPRPGPAPSPAYHLRWFTPHGTESPACGHATFAAGAVLLQGPHADAGRVEFWTKAGWLAVSRADHGRFSLRFPSVPLVAAPRRADVEEAFGITAKETYADDLRLHLVLESAAQVAAAKPDFAALLATGLFGVSLCAPAEGLAQPGFALRFFHPIGGIPEDPVTGSVTAALLPYWANRLGCDRLEVRQLSARGGALSAALDGDHAVLTGRCRSHLEGSLLIEPPARWGAVAP